MDVLQMPEFQHFKKLVKLSKKSGIKFNDQKDTINDSGNGPEYKRIDTIKIIVSVPDTFATSYKQIDTFENSEIVFLNESLFYRLKIKNIKWIRYNDTEHTISIMIRTKKLLIRFENNCSWLYNDIKRSIGILCDNKIPFFSECL